MVGFTFAETKYDEVEVQLQTSFLESGGRGGTGNESPVTALWLHQHHCDHVHTWTRVCHETTGVYGNSHITVLAAVEQFVRKPSMDVQYKHVGVVGGGFCFWMKDEDVNWCVAVGFFKLCLRCQMLFDVFCFQSFYVSLCMIFQFFLCYFLLSSCLGDCTWKLVNEL